MKAAIPSNEAERLKALRRYEILDTDPEPDFDDIALLASYVCGAPIALISFIDEDRQWFKSKVGVDVSEMPRDIAFGGHGILQPDVFEVKDALIDERFPTNPLVTGPLKIRFYAGSPLITPDGHALGMLCVIDQVPRELSKDQKAALQALSRQVVARLELRRSLTELRQSENRFSGAFEHAPIGVALVSPEGRWLKVNRALCDLVGYSEAELLVRTFQDITHPEDLAADLDYVRRLLAGEIGSYQMEKRYVHARGHLVTVSLNVSLVRDCQGKPGYFISQIQDITARRQIEASLQESQRRLRDLIDGLGPSMFVGLMTPEGIMIECNQAALAAAGLKTEDVLGKPFAETYWWAYSPEVQQRLRESIARAADGEASRYDVQIRVAENQLIDADFSLQPLRDETGKIVFLIPSGIIITERKRAEEELQWKSALLEAQVNSSTDGILIVDQKAHKSLQNQRFIDLLKIPQQIADEKTDENRLRWVKDMTKDPARFIEKVAYLYAHPDETSQDEIELRDGTVLDRYSSPVVGQDRTNYGRIWTFRDITERKLAENALRESKRFAESIAENSTNIIYLFDLETGRNTYANRSVAESLGYSQAQVLEMGDKLLATIVHPEDMARVAQHFAQFADVPDNRVVDIEYRMKHSNGDTRWIWSRDTVFNRRPNGAAWQIMGTAQDITDRKRAEMERQAISEIVQGAITTINLDELLDLAHRSIEKLLYAENCFVCLHDAETDLIHFEFWLDKYDGVPLPQPLANGFTRSSHVLRTGRPLLLTQELKAQLFKQDDIAQSGSDSPSWLGVPLRTPTRTIGVLAVQHYEKKDVYTQRDLEFLSSVGDQIALAIERKRADEDLRRSEERLAAAQHIAHIGNWELDLVTNKVTWSDEQYRLLGFTPGEIEPSSEHFFQCVHPNDREAARQFAATAVENQEPASIDLRVIHQSGDVRMVHRRAETLFDNAGRPISLIGTTQDVTELRDKESKLALSEERTRLIVGTAHDAFISMDAAGLITNWNPRAEATFGWSSEEAVGQPLHELIIPPRFRGMHVQGLRHFIATGEGPNLNKLIEVSAIHRDGHEMPVELMISPIRIGDAFIFSASVRDITARKAAQVELRQAKEAAEAANRAKSEFLANMSHEIRTPMNGILGMTELVLDTELNHEQREYLGMAKSSADALLGLINNILDFSKIEAGQLDLELIDFSLSESVSEMFKPLVLRAEQKGLQLRVEIADDVQEHLIGDPLRLRQILINLADNALKFTEHGSIVLKIATEGGGRGEQCLHFSIKDTGIGIPPEKQAMIFEAFAQVDGSTTRNYGGTGLGLTIVSQLVEQMCGKIWIESTLGAGTTFHFTACFGVKQPSALVCSSLPNETSPKLEPSSPDFDKPKADAVVGLRILLAEDNLINCALATAILEKQGHSLVQATNGREVVEATVREDFDMIFMDVQMPEMDGFEATRLIRESEKLTGRHVQIAAMTAHAMAGDRERCLAAGMDDYISKPLQKAELLALLQRISAGQNRGAASPPSTPNVHRPPGAIQTSAYESSTRLVPIFSRKELLDDFDGR